MVAVRDGTIQSSRGDHQPRAGHPDGGCAMVVVVVGTLLVAEMVAVAPGLGIHASGFEW